MHPLLGANLDQLRDLCRKHRVKRLDVFGSATRDDFDPSRSDLDFLVEFEPLPVGERSRHFFALEADLRRLFNRSVDLGEFDGIRNKYLQKSIEGSRVPIYAAA
ncbi:MAG: nucleotidyltransferase domain-containing protein [Phycisphaerales bacterium]|nr:nucleotidyltransferase domain-containing protein [Phycisphaerales bacterium]MCI0675970.1 nucleotidyltransferase domain-containing protein [Phycisphaerales bacterium]